MCEWLASAEWCDVQMRCRGRVFGAHRAVLASASVYLRRILLSCQDENTPTLIILPDFDLDAMFLVLYYIYNGEVTVPKSRLEPFLDIIVTLNIFVDKQFMGKIQDFFQGFDRDFEKFKACNKDLIRGVSYPRTVFKLKSNNMETVYVTIKKGLHSPILMQRAPDGGDKRELCIFPGPYLDNIQSLHGARQKRSLRDSFIEPYPRNGNVNGQPGVVPAILNEHYLAAASTLLTNANGKDVRPFHTLSTTSQCAEPVTHNAPNIHCANNLNTPKKSPYQAIETLINAQNSNTNNVMHPVAATAPANVEEPRLAHRKISALLDLTVAQSIANAMSSISYENYAEPRDKLHIMQLKPQCDGATADKSKNSAKKGISNHVMQSPWSSRMPPSYKPFRRKLQNKKNDSNDNDSSVVNDNNNNIEKPIKDEELLNNSKDESTTPTPGDELQSDAVEKLSDIQDEIKCIFCGQAFPDQASLAVHAKGHPSPRISCPECGKTFSQLRNFKYHMSVHRGTREFAATCSICGKYFNDRGYLSSHMKIHRNRKEYKCHLCPKSFNQRVAYNMHVRIHTGVKPHACEQCGKAFSRKMLLRQHQRTHSGERPYACIHCDKRFADRSNMTLHLRLHTGVKPFSCSLCPKSFTKKHHLKSHLNFHTGAKPYSCPRCQLAFTQSSNMRTHLKKCNAPVAN